VTIAKNIDGFWRPGTTQPTFKTNTDKSRPMLAREKIIARLAKGLSDLYPQELDLTKVPRF